MNSRTTSFRNAGMAALLLGVTLLAYLPALHGGLLWDDDGHVTKPELRSLHGLERIWFEVGATQQYYPLLHSAFWLEHRLWGDAVVGYHLVNILLHVLAACLVVAILRRLAVPGAWLAGGLFALHPVGVESVAWISEQKNTLSAVFYLGAALIYLGFDRDRRRWQYGAALGLFVLALLTKTVTATLPAALLVVFWWRRGRLDWRRDVRPLTPWLALGAAAGLVSAWVERAFIGAHGADFALTALDRGLLAGRVLWFYFAKLVWPADLVFIYPRWNVDAAAGWQYLFPLGVLAVAAGLGWVARRRRGPLAGFLFFAGTLFPALGFVNVYPFVFSYVADHFQYLASLGVIVPLAAGLTLAAARIPALPRPLAVAGAGVLLAVLGMLTWGQSRIYRDAQTLYRETLARNPACWMAHNNLGLVLSQIPGRMPEAIDHFAAAVKLNPGYAEAHLNLGEVLARIPGRLDEAIAEDEAAVRLVPDLAEAHGTLGVALAQATGRLPEAVTEFETAVRLSPGSATMHDHLGVALLGLPRRQGEAQEQLETAKRLNPDSAVIRDHLGMALIRTPGGLPEAMAQFEEAVRIDPGSAAARENLGKLLLQVPGRLPEAVEQLETAVRLDPGSADNHGALGSALLKVPERFPDAIAEFEAVVRIEPASIEGHYVLGVLLSGLPGRQAEARAHFETALRIQPDFAPAREGIERLRALGR